MSNTRTLSLGDRTLVAAIFLVLATFFPYFEDIHSANELSRLYLTNAIVSENLVSIDTSLDHLGNIHDKAFRDGRHYSDKAPGVSFFAVPAAWAYLTLTDLPTLEGEMRLLRLWVSVIPTIFLLMGMLRFLQTYIADANLRRLLVLGYGLGTLATTYSMLLFGHQLSAVLVFGAFMVAHDAKPDWSTRRAIIMGVLLAASLCVEYQNALFAIPVALFYCTRVRWSPRAISLALLGAFPLLAGLGWYHHLAFGGPLTTGYSFLTSSFKEVHEQGVMGIAWPSLDHLVLSFVDTRKGLLCFAPFLVLAIPGLFLVGRANGAGKLTAVMAGLYALFVISMVYPDGGWSVSQRHLTPLVPWLILPIGLVVQRAVALRPALVGLIALSVLVTGLSSIVWPHFQEHLENPFFQMAWPLFEHGWVPPSIFGSMGLSGQTVALLFAGAVAALLIADLCVWSTSLWQCVLSLGVAVIFVIVPLHYAADWHADQDVQRDQRFVQSVYELDEHATPTPFGHTP
jgi:hypothetical protein